MDRGLYIGALGMLAREFETEIISNDLANTNTVAYKSDTTVFKSFPGMFLSRLHDETYSTPFGEVDPAPGVGTMGLGVEVNDVVTIHNVSPSTIATGRPLDMALEGAGYGFFVVQTANGERYTRAGDFTLNSDGYLVTRAGAMVQGEGGPIRIDLNNYKFLDNGDIIRNPRYTGDGPNRWEAQEVQDRLRLVEFENYHGLEKEGYTLYRSTEESGAAAPVLFGVQVRTGLLEASSVNPVRAMVDLINAQRAYEASAKVIQTHDQILGLAINQVTR